MKLRQLGQSGLLVSELSFGAMVFGDRGMVDSGEPWRDVGVADEDTARQMVEMCLNAGVNFFDVADAYKWGEAEEILGRALKGHRDDVVIATKVRFGTGGGANDSGLSRRHILKAVEASLRRLGTDWIDLYQIHSIDPLTPIEETLSTLNDLVHAGKIRYIGASNVAAWHLMKALATSDRFGLERFVSLQSYYSLVTREMEWEFVPLCLDQGVGILPWSPLAVGFLTGRYEREQPLKPEAGRWARSASRQFAVFDEERGWHVLGEVKAIAQEREVSPAQVALNWLLQKSGVSSVIMGASTLDQLSDNLRAAEWELSVDEMRRLDQVSEPPAPYPYWHLSGAGGDRASVRKARPISSNWHPPSEDVVEPVSQPLIWKSRSV